MLRLMDSLLEAEQAYEFDPVLGCRIYTLYHCYQNEYSFLGLWTALEKGEITACISILSGVATITASEKCNFEELACFLSGDPTIDTIETSSEVGQRLQEFLKYPHRTRPVMKHCGTLPEETRELPLILSYSAITHLVFSVLLHGDPEFEGSDFGSWFYDVHRRIKRQHCEIYAAEDEQGNYVSTAGYYSSSPISAIVGGVATLPEHRKKGYATALVRHATARILGVQKDAYLIAAQEGLIPFYEAMGYEQIGEEWLLTAPPREDTEES